MRAKKKILFTSHTANFQKFNRPFMRMLREENWEVHYASAGEEDILDCDKEFKLPIERSPLKLIRNFKAYRQLKKIIERENYDIIHTHTPTGSVITRLAAISARKNGTKVIYTAHGFHFFKGAPILNWLTYYPIEKYMARHTDTIIAINKEDFNRATNKFKTIIKYIPGVGVEGGRFKHIDKKEALQLRKSLGLHESDFVMIFPAELNRNKNQKMLINAMKELVQNTPDIHLLLVGKDSLSGYHEKLINKHKLNRNIHLLGYRKDIASLLMSSDVSISSSLREGLPVNLMEAMFAGVPIIATDCRGNRDLVTTGVNGIVVPIGSHTKLKEAVLKLYRDTNLRTKLGSTGYKHSVNFTSGKIQQIIYSLYMELSNE